VDPEELAPQRERLLGSPALVVRQIRQRWQSRSGEPIEMALQVSPLFTRPGQPAYWLITLDVDPCASDGEQTLRTALQDAHLRLRGLDRNDPVTGLANRRGLNLALDRSWRRCLRTGSSLALLMIDIDYFKSYNDAHGHLAGDKCLGLLAQILKRACGRPDDLAARYGGEEFVLVLPETDLPGACRMAERIQKELTACALPHPGSGFGLLTISVGVSARVPSAEHDVAALLAEADRLLYVAKREGRNTLRSA
ncbi:MAG: GGDEF domain-containing protein, partial [Burkholderiales bacterium]